jgi:L-fuconolactonase
MIIDCHQHFWEYDPARHSWISDKMKILRRDYLPANLESSLKAGGIEGSVAVQAYMSESETDYLLQCAAGHSFIKGVVGWVNLCGAGVQERLEYFSKNPLLKGIRHIVQDEPDDFFMLRPDFQNGINLLSRYGLCYDILVYPRQLPAAIELVRRFPEQRFVLDHIAKPQISNSIDPQWEWHIRQLGGLPNVFCKLSGMVTETQGFRWNREEFYPFMDIVMQAFGPDRLMFGSDWPVCLLAATYEEVKGIVTTYLQAFTQKERQAVMGSNAVCCYGL